MQLKRKSIERKSFWSLLADLPRAAYVAGGFCVSLAIAALVIPSFAGSAPVKATTTAEIHGNFLGVATCAGSTCHGRNEADGEVVRQDELMRWQEDSSPGGAHSRAYRVLGEPRSLAIGKKLGIDPQSDAMCLGCHSTPTSTTGPRFQVNDGVGCEACHGPASGWLSSHYAVGASHANNVSRGMKALENSKVRADNCLDCHFGSDKPGQFVSHRIMAAGHPRISFELDLFSTLQQHHDEDADYAMRKGKTNSMQFWAVGQAMALDRSLSLFTKPGIGSEGIFPEFYFYDCHSCHRRIYDDEDARTRFLTNPGRPIPFGQPPYNDENMIMLTAAAKVLAPSAAAQFDARSKAFHAAMGQDRASAVQAAAALRQSAVGLADQFSRASFNRAQTFQIMETIASEAISPRFTDYEGAVQSVMAIDTLLNGLVNQGSVSGSAATALRVQINQAYAAVNDPNGFEPLQFRRALGNSVRTIRALN